MKIVRRLLAVLAVHLLSGWPAAQALTCSNPDSAYTVNVDGTVRDTRNGLIWKQCAEGQSGPTCSGSATSHTWSAALKLAASSTFAGASDWRLPNIKELNSISEKCRSAPSINITAFPGTPPSAWFWSASPYAPFPAYAWNVDFNDGSTGDSYSQGNSGRVRLVRSGQFFDSFDLATQQVITLGTAPSLLLVGGTALLSATGGASGLPVVFNSQTPTVCSVSGNNVSGVARGTCTIAANQAGNSSFSPAAQVTQSFTVAATPVRPGPPTNILIKAGNGSATLSFSAPSGSSIVSYTASCTASSEITRTVSGAHSPLTVGNLRRGVPYQCTLTATDSDGLTSTPSASQTVTPKKNSLTPILMLLLD